jgi:hypothetical protein
MVFSRAALTVLEITAKQPNIPLTKIVKMAKLATNSTMVKPRLWVGDERENNFDLDCFFSDIFVSAGDKLWIYYTILTQKPKITMISISKYLSPRYLLKLLI